MKHEKIIPESMQTQKKKIMKEDFMWFASIGTIVFFIGEFFYRIEATAKQTGLADMQWQIFHFHNFHLYRQ